MRRRRRPGSCYRGGGRLFFVSLQCSMERPATHGPRLCLRRRRRPPETRVGQTRAALERRGLVKTDFDLIIACTALALKATLVTNDRSLLDGSIPELQTANWLGGAIG